ncbi:MAG: Rne/Rng family ribonuclease [Pseudomonadota bacterium]
MAKKMLIDATHPEETRVVVVDGQRIEEFDYESVTKLQISGNIYLAKVTRVEPSLQAAFVDYGGNRHGFLAFAEIHPDYYQIPVADREALIAAQRAAEADADEDEDAQESAEGRKPSRRRNRNRAKSRGGDGAEASSNGAAAKGRQSDRPKVALSPLDASVALPERLVSGDAIDGLKRAANGPELPAWEALPEELKNPPAAETEAESGDQPDLGDVDQIEIRRAATDAEASELGDTMVVERIELDEDGAVASHEVVGSSDGTSAIAESAGAAAPDVVRSDATPSEDDEDDGDLDAGDDDEPSRSSDIEEVGASDARDEIRPRVIKVRDYKIQEVIKKRQIMLVQVVKEERGTKGAALTTYISLAGRYCVLMPNTARGGGISRKITNAADRKRLKAVANELEVPDGMGLIVRTAGANRTKAEIKRDYEYLLRQWSSVRELTLRSIAPALIYEEGSLIKRAIRDLYNKDIDAVLVEGEESYREAKDYMKMLMPSHAKNVQPYRDRTPLFIRHQVETQMASMMNPTVQLKSGGYLVIGVTEALVAVDVNSGRSTKESSIEETALKTNLEAADEVARQLRLRDLAGLIVIDFIDMEESKNNKAVEKRLKDKLKTDRARIQVGRISGFGLLEMSRQRLRPGLLEATTQPCPHCKGVGVIRSEESMALSILRSIEEEGLRGKAEAILLRAPISVANYLMNLKRVKIASIEDRYDLQVLIEADPTLISPDFGLERAKRVQRAEPERTEAIQIEAGFADQEIEDAEILEDEEFEDDAASAQDATRSRARADAAEDESAEDTAEESADGADAPNAGRNASQDDADGDADGEDRGGRKRRGRRGGRRRKSKTASSDPMPVIDLDESEHADGASETADDRVRHSSGARSTDESAPQEDAATATAAKTSQETSQETPEETSEETSEETMADASASASALSSDDASARAEPEAAEAGAQDGAEQQAALQEAVQQEAPQEAARQTREDAGEEADGETAEEDPAPSTASIRALAAAETVSPDRAASATDAASRESEEVAVLDAPSKPERPQRRRSGWWSARRGA